MASVHEVSQRCLVNVCGVSQLGGAPVSLIHERTFFQPATTNRETRSTVGVENVASRDTREIFLAPCLRAWGFNSRREDSRGLVNKV